MLVFFALSGCLVDTELYERRKAELTDHDGDGFAQVDDCDDADATISPDGVELCDGIDQDCDGRVDDGATDAPIWYPDVDVDGYGDAAEPGTAACDPPAAHVANALDCDDTRSSVHPGVVETPYDGRDDDCDGADLADVDGDGWDATSAGGDDCDDEDARVNPAAVEVPYDGVDQDCQDGDADDLDGDASAGVDAGGDDCDDTDAAIHPSAVETWANGFTDNDCDEDAGAAVLEFAGSAWTGWQAGAHLGRRTAALGDLDGNGLDDVLIGSEYDATAGANSGGVYALDGRAGGSIAAARSLLPDEPGHAFASSVDAGVDVTGDGVPDLIVSSDGDSDSAGAAWIIDGAGWVAGGDATVEDVEVGVVAGSGPGTYGPGNVRFVGDLTGDGVTDIAMGECCGTSSGPSSTGRVAIFSSEGFAGSMDDADVLIDGPWDNAFLGASIDALGDQDGDGLDELLVGGTGGLAAAVVGGTASGSLDDLALTVVYGEVSDGYAIARNTGDLDGDGHDDLAILGETTEARIALFTALGGAPTRVLEAPSCVFEWSEPGGVSDLVPLGDRDGDGRAELFVPQQFSDSGTQRAWILPGSAVSFGGTVGAETSALSAVSLVPGALFGYSASLAGDVDGDGQDDIVVGAPDYSASAVSAGGATLIPVPR